MFSLEDFKSKLGTPFRERYGKSTMGDATAKIWFGRLKSENFEHVHDVFCELLGTKDRPFSWKNVIDLLDVRHPPEDPQMALEKEWRGKSTSDEKRKELSSFMRGLMEEIKEAKRKKEAFDWMTPYTRAYIDIFGKQETSRVLEKISYGCNDTESKFVTYARKELR